MCNQNCFFFTFYLLNIQPVQISGVAKFTNGSIAEPEIPLVVTILDENDNPPYFELHSGNITEASKQGSVRLFGNSFVLLGKKKMQLYFISIPKTCQLFCFLVLSQL